MVLATVLLCTVVCFSPAYGFISPGPCPKLPPSNTSFPGDIALTIHTIVPFTTSDSLIFKTPNNMSQITCLVLDIDHGLKELTIGLVALSERTVRGFITGLSDGNVHLNSSIYVLGADYEPSGCHTPMTETLRFWAFKRGIILWSCREESDMKAHDEALIVATYKFVYYEEFKAEAENLLGEPLSQLIEWRKRVWYYCYQDDFYPCP